MARRGRTSARRCVMLLLLLYTALLNPLTLTSIPTLTLTLTLALTLTLTQP